jgi:hypothetical protein
VLAVKKKGQGNSKNGNIQIDSSELIADTFPESRFNSWAVSGIHVISDKIVPNGRRNEKTSPKLNQSGYYDLRIVSLAEGLT